MCGVLLCCKQVQTWCPVLVQQLLQPHWEQTSPMQAAQLASIELQTAQELLRGRKGPGACQAITARSLSLQRMQVLHLGRAMLLQGAGQAGGAAHCHPLPAAGGRSRAYHIGFG